MEHTTHNNGLTRQTALDFLRTHLPQSDLDCYDEALFLQFVDHALALREAAPWCAELDEEIFLHYVLFPRVNDEDLSFHREIFRSALWERILPFSTTAEMLLEVNRWCHETASYQMQDDRTASPLTVYRCASGRCGEESAFLVSALRSIGIPARQVYSPRWAHCDDNHAWVEALCDGQWRFLGACEPEPIPDRGWFNSPASRALLVHSRCFGEASHPLHGEKISTENGVIWFNQTHRYAHTHAQTFRALIDGIPAAGAAILIQVLNEASFHTIATLTTDKNGEATIALGIGDFHIFAYLGDYFTECNCKTGSEIVLSLDLFHNCGTDWCKADFIAPLDAPVNPALLDAAQKRERAAVLADGRGKREARIAAMLPAGAEHTSAAELLRSARGNAAEISRFLSRGGAERINLLQTLSEKDLRDVTTEILESHLRCSSPRGDLPEDIYTQYVLSPRIELEPLTAWRELLLQRITDTERSRWSAAPTVLWRELRDRIAVSAEQTYANLVWTPESVWNAHRCDERSLRILCVALLRSIGTPARLRRLDGMPEFFRDGAWMPIEEESTAVLRITSGESALYRQNWTLSRRGAHGWMLLKPEDPTLHSGTLSLTLPAGTYRLQTSIRMPNGNQFAAHRDIVLCEGGSQEIALQFRSYALSDLLRHQQLPVMSARTLTGTLVADLCRTDGRPTILFWLEDGGEPTEHVLNELLDAKEKLESLPVNLIFLPQRRESLKQETLRRVLEQIPAIRVLLSDWDYDLETVARHLTCDPDTPPLVVICGSDGSAVYGMSGYSVGAVDLLIRIAEHIL